MSAVMFEQKRLIDTLKKENADLQEKVEGLSGAYQILLYAQEHLPSGHDLLARDRRINLLERLLDKEVQGWQFKLRELETN